jgi:catechol 2,3-dioxygenase-like lactoylglutathione lyase family enzyme
MSTTQIDFAVPEQSDLARIPLKFEVATLPVTDIDRAKAFYRKLGWRLDIDVEPAPGLRAIQFTPPGSPASIQFRPAESVSEPLQRLYLIVDDVEAAREEIAGRGIDISGVFHAALGEAPAPGVDPEHRSYASFASFTDPDGNQWLLQEIKERLPGRV